MVLLDVQEEEVPDKEPHKELVEQETLHQHLHHKEIQVFEQQHLQELVVEEEVHSREDQLHPPIEMVEVELHHLFLEHQ